MKKRFNYFIYPQFQLSLLLVNVIANLFLFTCLKTRVSFYFDSLIEAGMEANLPRNHIFFRFIEKQLVHLGTEFYLVV